MVAFRLFNPNDWRGISKAIVLSCSTELSALHYEASYIAEICRFPKKRCRSHFKNLKHSWKSPDGSLNKTVCFAQVPELHAAIKAFFAGLKGLLDLIVQLLPAENVVNVKLDGFHRKDKEGVPVYGATVLNALSNNACAGKKKAAQCIRKLIIAHKEDWIDDVIKARDLLIHPTEGAHQLMFEMQLESFKNELIYRNAVPPSVGSRTIDIYTKTQIKNIEKFSQSFLEKLRCNETTA